jgi:hypothetical protein
MTIIDEVVVQHEFLEIGGVDRVLLILSVCRVLGVLVESCRISAISSHEPFPVVCPVMSA